MQAEAGEQGAVGIDLRVAGDQQGVAVKNGIGAGQKAQRLNAVAQFAPPGGQPHPRRGHGDARRSHGAYELEGIEIWCVFERRSGHPHQGVDGHRFGVGIEPGQLRQQTRTVAPGLAHADDAAAAHRHAGFAHGLQRVQALLVGAGGDDLAVELGRGVEVVVVVIEPGIGQALRLRGLQHTQSHAGFQPEGLDAFDHGGHGVEIAVFRLAPGRAHAKACRARLFGRAGVGQHEVKVHQLARLQPDIMMGRLRAVTAVFGAAAGLDRQQRRELNIGGVEVRAVDLLGLPEQIGQGLIEQGFDALWRPDVGRFQGHGISGDGEGR